MIKKIIACLTICFIITGIISPVFSDASALPQPNWSDPGISEIINISDLTGWMLNGGTFDVSSYTDAESFMNDYYNSRTQTRLVSPSESPQDDYYEVLPGFGINNQLVAGDSFARPLDTNRVIASSFRDHTGYGRRLSNEVNNALLSSGSLYYTKIPLLNEIEFSNFVGYNHNALNIYKNSFYSPDIPIPNPDPSYLNYINTANNNQAYGFFWGDAPLSYNSYTLLTHPCYEYSWFANFGSNWNVINYSENGFKTNSATLRPSSGILSLFINSNQDNTYTGTISNINSTDLAKEYYNGRDLFYYSFNYIQYSSLNNFFKWSLQGGYYDQNRNPISNATCSYTGTLDQVMDYFCNRFRNINIYVNNVPWAIIGNPVTPPHITPEFPDAVGGEDLSTTTWPISRPRAPYYTNIPGVLQAIEDAITDDGKLDIDDLKPYLTDENGDPVPDPIFDPEPVPIPVPDPVNPDVVPGLPVLPAMPPVMPGFSGVSVLAEIINFTNQSLPTALIVTFWGIIFGIVILGLIKILHK